MIADRLLSEIDRQKKYLAHLPENFEFPLFNAMQALESQRRNGYRNTAAAARELVDNALEAGAKRTHVVFEKPVKGRELVTSVAVVDDGAGMLRSMARYALSWGGGTHFDEPNFIGRFGFGLPNASINQTRRVEVYTRTNPKEKITKAWLDANDFPQNGLQHIPEPVTGDLPPFVQQYLERNGMDFAHGTVVVWVQPDRLTYKTAASLKEHLLDDFGTTYRYLLEDLELKVEGVKVEPVDPLFLDPKARFYIPPDKGGAILVEERNLPVLFYRDTDGAAHLRKLKDQAEVDTIRQGKTKNGKEEILAVGAINFRVANFPLGLVRGAGGKANIQPIDEDSKKRFEIRQSRRGMSFVRAGREVETVDAFPRSSKDLSSGLGDWPHLESYAYHWGIEVKFGPDLDDVFGITNDKQRVRPLEDFWKLLFEEKVDDLLRRTDNQQRVWRKEAAKAAREPQAAPEATPAEIAASVVDTVVGKPTPIPEHERPKVQEKFKEAAQKQAEVSGKSLDEAAKAVEAEAKRRPFKIEYFEDQYAPFYRPDWGLGSQIVVWVNRKHPFYGTFYTASKSKLAKEGLDLFLIALSKAELNASDPTARLWYEQQRTKEWSEFLAIAMRDLANRFEGVEEEEEAA